MKKVISFILYLFVFSTITPVWGQEKGCSELNALLKSERVFKDGESLTLVLNYRGMGMRLDVGEAEISVKKGDHIGDRDSHHAVFAINTFKFWDVFFKVRDHHESMFYDDNLRPIYFHRDVNEGKHKVKNLYWWNEDNTITAKIEQIEKAPLDTVFAADACTFDVITLVYYIRNLDFDKMKPGVKYKMSFAIDKKINNLAIEYVGEEIKKIPKLGSFRTIKLSIVPVDGNVFKGEQTISLWISADKNKIPVFMESPVSMGAVQARLSEYSDLKYPLASKIE